MLSVTPSSVMLAIVKSKGIAVHRIFSGRQAVSSLVVSAEGATPAYSSSARSESFDRRSVERKDRLAVIKNAFCCRGQILLTGEEDDVLSPFMLGTRVDDAVEPFAVLRTVLVAKVLCEDLRWDVVDVFPAIVHDGLRNALDKGM